MAAVLGLFAPQGQMTYKKPRHFRAGVLGAVKGEFYCSSDRTDCAFWLAWANMAVPACEMI